VDILSAMRDPALFGGTFAGPTWDSWQSALAAVFGLPLSPEQLDLFQACTGRQAAPTERSEKGSSASATVSERVPSRAPREKVGPSNRVGAPVMAC
jgi:hypothetical protein